jgi:uncharacterized protein DUF4124
MKLLLTFLFVAVLVPVHADTVYKSVDEKGNVIFTDKPSADAEQIKIQKLQTIENPNPIKTKGASNKSKSKEETYKTLKFTSPEDGAGIRDNAGSVSISLTLEPGLRGGDKIIISMDGEEISNGSATSISLSNVDRGTHSLSASVVDGKGKKLISTSSSFSLLRQPAPRKSPKAP